MALSASRLATAITGALGITDAAGVTAWTNVCQQLIIEFTSNAHATINTSPGVVPTPNTAGTAIVANNATLPIS